MIKPILFILVGAVLLGCVVLMALRTGDWNFSTQYSSEKRCSANLSWIGLATSNYESLHSIFPSPNLNGHSWRIRVLPFGMASELYQNYRFDEPWNSDNNISLDSRLPSKHSKRMGEPFEPHGMPYFFPCSKANSERSTTPFLMFVGESAFGRPNGVRQRNEIVDDPTCTIIAAETRNAGIHWLEPKDFNFDEMSMKINDPDKLSISSVHANGPAVLFADGEVFRISPKASPAVLSALITIDGNEPLNRQELVRSGLLRR